MPPSAQQPSWTTQDGASHPTVQRCIALIEERFPPAEAGPLRQCAEFLFRRAAWRFLEQHDAKDLAGLLGAVYHLLLDKDLDGTRVRVFNPTEAEDGWECPHTFVLAALRDRPFLYDSVQELLRAEECRITADLHPVFGVERTNGGLAFLAPLKALHRETVLVFELSRLDADRLPALAEGIQGVFAQVEPATEDYAAMLARVNHLITRLQPEAAAFPELTEDVNEAIAFLEWLKDKNFAFLGFREYDLEEHDGAWTARVHPDSGLGILRDARTSAYAHPVPLTDLPPDLQARATDGPFLIVAKTNREGVVHRRTRMDYIGVKKLDAQGRSVGEYRFLGLFTAAALGSAAAEVPVLRRKLATLLDRTGLPPGSHDYKMLVELFEGLPKDELFQATPDELQESIDALVATGTDPIVRCVIREDYQAHTLAIMLIVPRDRYSAQVRRRMQSLLQTRFNAEVADYHLGMGTGSTARLHFTLRMPRDRRLEVSRVELEHDLEAAIQTWEDRLRVALADALPPAEADAKYERWHGAFPLDYQTRTPPDEAVADIHWIESAHATDRPQISMRGPGIRAPGVPARLKLFSAGQRIVLSDVMPVLEHMGLRVLEEVPTEVTCSGGTTCFIHDFGVVEAHTEVPPEIDAVGKRLGDAILQVLAGNAQSDGLNALVIRGGMTRREVELMRTCLHYYRQLGTAFTAIYLGQVLVTHADVCRLFLQYFHAKFAPQGADRPAETAAAETAAVHEEACAAIDRIESLEADRILRAIFNVMESTVRTNYFCEGGLRPYLSLKIQSADVLQMPLPRPYCEVFVHSPHMEAIHLRGGKVARGGIRWSDRPEDYRTEILGLMKTQMIKNAVIVPVGAKGGFILRAPARDRETLAEQVREQYSVFMRGLLDVTDNIVEGAVVHPTDVVAYDGPDPYLVVAADKGTAHLSDTANGISAGYGFWLGDAFASGGSAGYDHKKEGITARGAWECAKRHFRELGKDIQQEPFTVVGVGDMGGDVFGNGMLQSRATKLVAAFNHLHIFLDPDPEPERAWEERKRLFELPRSSWADYDPALIAAGGGVYGRNDKHVAITPEVQAVLGITATALSGPELVRAILQAPVEMMYHGGIGTYVKHSRETHLEVGDKANDAVRVDGAQVRATVVVEGGNLGITQQGRIELAQHGVRLNTDATDNSAGVDMSDHEVNLKVLLAQAIHDGVLAPADRDALLEELTDTVAEQVLRNNYRQSLVISQDEYYARKRSMEYRTLLTTLADEGGLDRETEFLPSDEDLQTRAGAGQGLARPELAILLGYTKNWLCELILRSPLVDDPHLHQLVEAYFPPQVVARFPAAVRNHRLRRELLATEIANRVVNQAGTTFVQRLSDQTGCDAVTVVWAYLVGNEMFRFDELRSEIFGLDGTIPTQGQHQALRDVESVLTDLAKWILQNVTALTPISEVLTRFQVRAESAVETLLDLYAELEGADIDALRRTYLEQGLTEAVAEHFVLVPALRAVLDVLLISEHTGVPVEGVAALYLRSGHQLRIGWLLHASRDLPAASQWERMALDSAREDLQLQHRRIVYDVLRSHTDGEPALECMRRYWDEHARPINSYLGTVAQFVGPGDMNLAVLNVVSRFLKGI